MMLYLPIVLIAANFFMNPAHAKEIANRELAKGKVLIKEVTGEGLSVHSEEIHELEENRVEKNGTFTLELAKKKDPEIIVLQDSERRAVALALSRQDTLEIGAKSTALCNLYVVLRDYDVHPRPREIPKMVRLHCFSHLVSSYREAMKSALFDAFQPGFVIAQEEQACADEYIRRFEPHNWREKEIEAVEAKTAAEKFFESADPSPHRPSPKPMAVPTVAKEVSPTPSPSQKSVVVITKEHALELAFEKGLHGYSMLVTLKEGDWHVSSLTRKSKLRMYFVVSGKNGSLLYKNSNVNKWPIRKAYREMKSEEEYSVLKKKWTLVQATGIKTPANNATSIVKHAK